MRRVRLALAAALLATAGGAFLAARALSAPEGAVVPPGSSGVIVLDVSSSIEAATYERREAYQQTARALEDAAASGGRYGVVLFSDVAYEALPATTPGEELGSFQRYFLPQRPGGRPGAVRTIRLGGSRFAANPWTRSFTAGTKISTGLRLARRMLRRDGVRDPVVVLISDLNTEESDIPALSKVVLEYGRRSLPLRIVAVGAGESDKELFRRLTARAGVLVEPEPLYARGRPDERTAAASPALLVALGGLLLVLLAANEVACARVAWRRRAVVV